jgi:hypothetical protein
MNHFIEILENLDLEDFAETADATTKTGKYHQRFLVNAMETYLPPLVERVETLIKSDIPKKTLGFNAPSP